MVRCLWVAPLLVALAAATAMADEKGPGSKEEAGTVQVELRGKLVRQEGVYCVKARNESGDTFLVQLVRTEDKNQDLDKHIEGMLGRVVTVRGTLRFISGRSDGPQLGVPVRKE